MANYYNLDSIKTHIKQEIDKYQCMKEAWENVAFPTKKNGEPFANMSKNFENAFYNLSLGKALNPILKVNYHSNLNGYGNDVIYLYTYEKYMKEENYIVKKDKNVIDGVYIFDLEDIHNAVKTRIDCLEKYINSLKRQMEIADSAYSAFRKAYKNAMEVLNKVTETTENTYCTLKVNILDTVKERYPYC